MKNNNTYDELDEWLNTDTYYYLFGFINIGKSVGYWDGSSLKSWIRPFVKVVHK